MVHVAGFSVIVACGVDADHLVQLLGRVSQKALQVTDEAVDVALARRLMDDVLVIVVAQSSAKLLIVHLGFVFALAPPSGDLVRVGQLEFPAISGPANDVLAGLICQKLQEKLP